MILITGATGFVGRHLIRRLLLDNQKIRVLLRPGSKALALKGFDIEKIQGNPFNVESLEPAFKDVSIVIHCAGVLKGLSYNDYYKGNVLYTQNLVEAAQKYAPNLKKFIHLSSQAASGPSESTPKKESESDHPISWYGLSKLLGEKKVKESTLPYIVLRPSGIYGPADHEFLPVFKMGKKRIQVMVGNGRNQINLLHVNDLVETICSSISQTVSRELFYLCDGVSYSWRDIYRIAGEAIGKKPVLIAVPKFIAKSLGYFNSFLGKLIRKPLLLNKDKIKEGLQDYWIFDNTKSKNLLNFNPKYTALEGFKETYQWYLKEKWL